MDELPLRGRLGPTAGGATLLALRAPGAYRWTPGADLSIICFPSFHVIWALLSARALWGFRMLRLPIAVLTPLIILSTITTGWHYASDVLGGLLIAALAITTADAFTRMGARSQATNV
jgi:membrane-associated phospholipid phosphatase